MPEPEIAGGGAPNAGADPAGSSNADQDPSLGTGSGEPEGQEITPQPDGEQHTGDQRPDKTAEPSEDNRLIPGYLRELKDKNPEAYKRGKVDFFDLRERRSVHPTVQAARDEHELVQGLGGPQAIAQLREDGAFFKEAAQQFMRADRAFYLDLAEEDQTAFEMGLPVMLDVCREKSKDVYESTIARLWDEEFQKANFDNALDQIAAAIESEQPQRAMQWLKALLGWKQRIASKASRAEDPRLKRVMAERAAEQADKGKAEKTQFLNTYQAETIDVVVKEAAKAFDSHFRNRKFDEEDRTDLLREVLAIANKAVVADKEFERLRDQHLANGDAGAARRLTLSRFAKVMPDALKRVARRYGYMAGSPKPAPTNKDGAKGPGTPPAPEKGFVQVNARPAPHEIDQSATSSAGSRMQKSYSEMIMAGLAVLKDGRKVSWAHLKQKVA